MPNQAISAHFKPNQATKSSAEKVGMQANAPHDWHIGEVSEVGK